MPARLQYFRILPNLYPAGFSSVECRLVTEVTPGSAGGLTEFDRYRSRPPDSRTVNRSKFHRKEI